MCEPRRAQAADGRGSARKQRARRLVTGAMLAVAAAALAACGGLPAPRQPESVLPSPVAYVAAAPLPEATATPTLVPLPTPTLVPATAVPKQLPQESTAAIGLWSDNVASSQLFPGFLDLAGGAGAFDFRDQRNQRLITLTGEQAQAGDPGSADALRAERPGWLLFDRNRRVVMSSIDEDAPVLDIRNEEVRSKLAEDVAAAVAQRDYAGVVVDSIGIDLIRPTAAPIFTGTKVFTASQRRDAVEGLLRAIRSRVPDKLLIIGGYAWRDGTAFSALAEEAQNLATLADGVHIEAFLRSPISRTNEFKSEASWKRDVDYLSAVSQDNKVVLITTRLPAGAEEALIGQWLSYSVASYLLGKNGAHTYFQFDAGNPALSNDPILSAPIGAPVEAYVKLDGGIYQRKFEKGLVLVNPTSEQKKAAIEGQYKTLAGNPAESNVTLGPRTGVILLQQ